MRGTVQHSSASARTLRRSNPLSVTLLICALLNGCGGGTDEALPRLEHAVHLSAEQKAGGRWQMTAKNRTRTPLHGLWAGTDTSSEHRFDLGAGESRELAGLDPTVIKTVTLMCDGHRAAAYQVVRTTSGMVEVRATDLVEQHARLVQQQEDATRRHRWSMVVFEQFSHL